MSATRKRKLEHLRICLEKDVQARAVKTGFEDVQFVHRCLANVDLEDVDTSTRFLGKEFAAPLFISAMTGGVEEAAAINANLAEAAEKLQIGMCLGSQRAAIEDASLEHTYRVARERAPSAFLSANLGISEVLRYEPEKVRRTVEMLSADALTIHLNPLQEFLQLEGERQAGEAAEKISAVARLMNVPVVVKETGAGISREDALTLRELGVRALEIAGAGGTSWAGVEYYRSLLAGDERRAALAEAFWDWGIPTVASLLETGEVKGLEVVASGGVRNGIQVAKALALGASLGGLAQRVLKAATEGAAQVVAELETMIDELRITMALTGARSIQELRARPIIITGLTADWIRQRDIQLPRR
ncbi:MAG: type 2 isopentenyl-diphosphate Delta-isomerase [Candidatus Bathyarchaeia archaeon]